MGEQSTERNVNGVVGPLTPADGVLSKDWQREEMQGPNVIRLPLKRDQKKLAFTLENVLRTEECRRLIDAAEDKGFGVAGLGTQKTQLVNTALRDSGRLIVDDPELAGKLFLRVKPFLPRLLKGRRILGLNEHLKFLRYRLGQKFVAHTDGAFMREGTENQTLLTLQFYISQQDGKEGKIEGGATRFLGNSPEAEGHRCLPHCGRALVFQHDILHEGEEVGAGLKYTIRTDVEYSGYSPWYALCETLGLGASPATSHMPLLSLLGVILSFVSASWFWLK